MSDPKLHHYVPRFYLERFTDDDGRLWVFDKEMKRYFRSSPKGMAAETHFYHVPELSGTKYTALYLEKQFSILESHVAKITKDWLNQLNNCNRLNISSHDRSPMALFIALQYLRTAESRSFLNLIAQSTEAYKQGVSKEELRNMHARLICDSALVRDISQRVKQSI